MIVSLGSNAAPPLLVTVLVSTLMSGDAETLTSAWTLSGSATCAALIVAMLAMDVPLTVPALTVASNETCTLLPAATAPSDQTTALLAASKLPPPVIPVGFSRLVSSGSAICTAPEPC